MNLIILLSTYNGEKYISEQLDSVLKQKGVDNLEIIIRDDGSTDDTISIIETYMNRNANIKLIKGNNVGCDESFNILANYVLNNYSADYYAFCDQDDVWKSDKLKVALEILSKYDQTKPNLYFSNLTLVDSNLKQPQELYKPDEVINIREMTFIRLFIFACTSVFNRKALEYYCTPKKNNCGHDHWIFVICSLLGNVYYDSSSHILYRQHDNNVSGKKERGFKLQLLRLRSLIKGKVKGHLFEELANQFVDSFGQMIRSEDLKLIHLLQTYRYKITSKVKLLFFSNYKTGNICKDFAIKYRILTNHL